MAYALVGSLGAVTQNGVAAAVTPAWGAGESRSPGNLLILWVAADGTAATIPAPSGWSIGKRQPGGSSAGAVFYRLATGSDAAPTIAGIAGTVLAAMLGEFSGGASSAPLDQVGSAGGVTSPQTATAAAPDAAPGELVIYAAALLYSAAATQTFTDTLNNGASVSSTNSSAQSTVDHYDFGWGITTGNGGADSEALTFATTNVTSVRVALATFKLPATAIALAGAGSSSSNATGTLSLSIALAGAGSSSSNATGTLTVSVPLAGLGSGSSSSTGTLTVTVPVAGLGFSSSNASGTLALAVALAGPGQSSSTARGTLSVVLPAPGLLLASEISRASIASKEEARFTVRLGEVT